MCARLILDTALVQRSNPLLPRVDLGRTGSQISVLGLGCASLWAHARFDEKRASAVLEQALALGINFFDTGASYAAGGAERRLGRVLRASGASRETLLIGSKLGSHHDEQGRLVRDFRPAAVASAVTGSLERLGVDHLDLLQLHGPTAEELSDELLAALQREQQAGRVRWLGVNAHDGRVIEQAAASGVFDVVMPFISVLRPEGRVLVQAAAGQGLGVLAAEPLGRMRFAPPLRRWLARPSGWWYLARLLAGGWRPGSHKALRRTLLAPGWTPAQLALRWTLEQTGVHCAVAGTTRPEHLRALAAAAERPLPEPVARALAALLPPV